MGFLLRMNHPAAGPSSKSKSGASQSSETSFKRKRGVFQKECKLMRKKEILLHHICGEEHFWFILFLLWMIAVQHMMYGFGDDPNVSWGFTNVSMPLVFFSFGQDAPCFFELGKLYTHHYGWFYNCLWSIMLFLLGYLETKR